MRVSNSRPGYYLEEGRDENRTPPDIFVSRLLSRPPPPKLGFEEKSRGPVFIISENNECKELRNSVAAATIKLGSRRATVHFGSSAGAGRALIETPTAATRTARGSSRVAFDESGSCCPFSSEKTRRIK